MCHVEITSSTCRYVTCESRFALIPPVASYSSNWISTPSIHSFKAGISLSKFRDSPKAVSNPPLASVIWEPSYKNEQKKVSKMRCHIPTTVKIVIFSIMTPYNSTGWLCMPWKNQPHPSFISTLNMVAEGYSVMLVKHMQNYNVITKKNKT